MLVNERIGRVLGEQLGPHQSWDSGSRLREDLELDQLDLVELAMRLEEEFGIQIPDGDEEKLGDLTVSGLADYLQPRIDAKPVLLT